MVTDSLIVLREDVRRFWQNGTNPEAREVFAGLEETVALLMTVPRTAASAPDPSRDREPQSNP